MKIIPKAHVAGHIIVGLALLFVLKSVSDVFLKPYVVNEWKSVLYGDKAGYNIYLPATFIYNWNGNDMPDSLYVMQGYAYSVNESGKIITKYPVGCAYFQAPFFLFEYAQKYNTTITGTEKEFVRAASYSTLFFVVLGMVLLAEAFRKMGNNFWLAWLVSLLLFFSSNLFYYTLKSPGYSHPYSFFLFSLLIYTLPVGTQRISAARWITVGFTLGLIFTVRTVNVLFALIYITGILWARKENIGQLFSEKYKIIAAILCSGIPVVPQMLYWKYAFGQYITNSYKGEGFIYWDNPHFAATLFSTNNGLFIFNPIWILFFIAIIFLFAKSTRVWGFVIAAIFVLQIYLCSSWSSPYFGCSFGHRAFADLLPMAGLGLFLFLHKLIGAVMQGWKKVTLLGTLFTLSSLCIVYSQRVTVNFNACWGRANLYDYDTFYEEYLNKKPAEVAIH